jgi:hypothetical protein
MVEKSFVVTSEIGMALRYEILNNIAKGFSARVEFEIQDMGLLVLFRVWEISQANSIDESQKHEMLLSIGRFLQQKLPVREDEYRWVVSLMKDEKVVDAVCGGWERVPMTP